MTPLILVVVALLYCFYISADAMHKSDVIPGTLVQLQYSDRTRRKQINREISNRAQRLDNTPAVVMERPFWDNGTRFVMIKFKESTEFGNGLCQ